MVLHRAVVERELLEEERQEQKVLDELPLLLEFLPQKVEFPDPCVQLQARVEQEHRPHRDLLHGDRADEEVERPLQRVRERHSPQEPEKEPKPPEATPSETPEAPPEPKTAPP